MADRFQEALRSDSFAVAVRFNPPRGFDVAAALASAEPLKERATALVIGDNPSARLGMSALLTADRARQLGFEVILTLSCRDQNRMALASTALGAAAAGIENVLCVSGVYPNLGDHKDAKPVYDLDSVQLIGLFKEMEQGRDAAGSPLSPAPVFFLGAAVCAAADPIGPQAFKARKKVAAGAEFLITLPIFDLGQADEFFARVGDLPAKILAGLLLPSYQEILNYRDGSIPGTFIPEGLVRQWQEASQKDFLAASADRVRTLITEIRKSGRFAGVCIGASGREAEIAGLL